MAYSLFRNLIAGLDLLFRFQTPFTCAMVVCLMVFGICHVSNRFP